MLEILRLRGDGGEDQLQALEPEHYFINWHNCQPSAPENSAVSNYFEDCFLKHIFWQASFPDFVRSEGVS